MSLATTVNKVQYTANGSTTVFSFPYKFNTNGDLVVIETNVSTGVDTTKTLTTDYTVSGAGNSGGGSVTFLVAPVNSRRITIERLVALTQETDYQPDDDFPAEVHEAALDKLTMIAQQLNAASARTLKAPVADSITLGTLPVDTLRANKALVFDATGQVGVSADNYVDQTTAAAASASAAASSASAASTSATNAASSASAASGSASAASGSATSAASSASAAAATLANAVTRTSATGAAVMPTGTTGERPTPATGHFRFNSSLSQFEGYNGTAWGAVGGGATGGTGNQVIYENDQTVSADYTLTAGKNGMSAGPITVNAGITLTVPSGAVYTVV
jgi:hypothetical protein